MSRNRFRSQPALDRGQRGVPLWGAALVLAGAGVASALLVSGLNQAPPPAPKAPPPARVTLAAATPQPAAPPAPAVQAMASPTPAVAPAVAPHPSHKAPHALPAATSVAPAADPWRTYAVARQAYDDNERAEGYRWAQQYRISAPSYCQAAQQRTPAFMEGCLDYLKS